MNLIDSNIIIYSYKPKYAHLRSLVSDTKNFVSVMTRIEVLGYSKLDAQQKTYFEGVFNLLQEIDLNKTIADKAIQLRQSKKYSLGDAIIAATAIEYNLTLQTNNEKDFKKISNLKVANPI